MNTTSRARLTGIVATGGLVMAAIAGPSSALATQPTAGSSVTICHATNSDTNPYVLDTVDIASSGHLRGGHDTQHDGPIWSAALKAAGVQWGDIIPAYTYGEFTFPGQNLGLGGEAVLDSGCAMSPTSGAVDVGDPETQQEQPTDEQSSHEPTDGPTEQPTDAATEQPTDELPTDEQPTGEQPTGEGEVVVDPTFIVDEQPTDEQPTDEQPAAEGEVVDHGANAGTPDTTPVGAVLGATSRPEMTPPATDTIGEPGSTTAGGGLHLILLALAGLSTLVLMLGRVPAARRS